MSVVRCRANDPGDFGSEHERRIRAVLVEAAGEQCVGECCAGRVHVDDNPVPGGFVDLGHLDRVRTI
jgi:hypothetical protein